MSERLDAFDIQLLALLQKDALATAERLAEAVPLSPSAITRRVRRLREDKWIEADVSVPARRLADTRLRALVFVQVHEHAEERGIAALRASLAGAPEVQLLLDVAGSYDLALLVIARDMADFNALTARLLEADPAVRRYESSFVKRTHKFTTALPLAPGDGG